MDVRLQFLQRELDETREDRLRVKRETADRLRAMEHENRELI
jgi:hypothetical protein